MLKSQEISLGNSCLNKCASDEPIFVLRGKDICAAQIVRAWADFAESYGVHEPEKIAEARALADAMQRYATSKASR